MHREIVEKSKSCSQCQKAGKNLKCLKSQNEFGKTFESNKPKEEIALDFAGSLQNGNQKNFFLLVSVDSHSGWPIQDALFLPNPTTKKVIEFVSEKIAANGLPKRIRTDPGTVFKVKNLVNFSRKTL